MTLYSFQEVSKPSFVELFSWKDESRWESSTICTDALNDCSKLEVSTVKFVMRLMCMGYKEFDWLHPSPSFLLATFLIHVVDITSQYTLLLKYLLLLIKMLINVCFVETLGSKRIKARWFAKVDWWVLIEEFFDPFFSQSESNDLLKFESERSSAEWLAC